MEVHLVRGLRPMSSVVLHESAEQVHRLAHIRSGRVSTGDELVHKAVIRLGYFRAKLINTTVALDSVGRVFHSPQSVEASQPLVNSNPPLGLQGHGYF